MKGEEVERKPHDQEHPYGRQSAVLCLVVQVVCLFTFAESVALYISRDGV